MRRIPQLLSLPVLCDVTREVELEKQLISKQTRRRNININI